MKKTYREPLMLIIEILHTKPLASSIDDGVSGNADFYYGGGSSGDTEGRVKQQSLWDDNWDE
jgi:hypothetical protein